MQGVDIVLVFDVAILKDKYPEFNIYWEREDFRNGCGKKHYIHDSTDYKDVDDETHFYENFDERLISLGGERGQWVILWFSW